MTLRVVDGGGVRLDEAFAAAGAAGLVVRLAAHCHGRIVVVDREASVLYLAVSTDHRCWPRAVMLAVNRLLDARRRDGLRLVV